MPRARSVAAFIAVLTALSVLTATPAEAAPRTGRLVIVINTPRGVPVTVSVTGAAKRTVTKAPSGRRVKRTIKVKAGRYAVRPRQIVRDNRVYVPVKSVQRVRVKMGRTTRVTVVYRRVSTATALRVRSLGTSSISIGWSAPKKAVVRVRVTSGPRPASSVRSGRAVRVKGRTATATGLKQGGSHTLSVFTRVKGRWIGPVSLTASPRAAPSSGKPTFVAAPNTVMVPAASPVSLSPRGTQVTSTVPSGMTPVVGQSWVIPSTARLPGGYLGRVVSVGSTGTTVTLVPIGYPEAFTDVAFSAKVTATEKLRIASATRIPQFTADQPARGRATFFGPLASEKCDAGPELTLVAPSAKLTGSADYSFIRTKRLGITVGARMSSDVDMKLDWSLGLAAGMSLDCQVTFHEIERAMAAGPIPVGLKSTIHGKFELNASGGASFGVSASMGVKASATVKLGSIQASAKPRSVMEKFEPQITGSGTAAVQLGGDVLLGPGTALPKAGAIAGLRAAVYPIGVSASKDVESPACWRVKVSSSADVDLEASAWFRGHEIKGRVPLFTGTIDHVDESVPQGCENIPTTEPTPEPTQPTEEPTDEPTDEPLDPGAHRLVSVTSSGEAADNGSGAPSISGDGRYVAYYSGGVNLDPERPRSTDTRVYVHDRVTGAVTPAPSTGSSEPMVRSYNPAMSRDGRFVAYSQQRFVEGNLDSTYVTVWDRESGTATRLPGGDLGFGAPQAPEISTDGRFVVYGREGPGGYDTVFLWDRTTGTSSELPLAGSSAMGWALSADGAKVAVTSGEIEAEGTGGTWQLSVWDRAADARSVVTAGSIADGWALPGDISDDGNLVSYTDVDIPKESASVRLWDRRDGSTRTAPVADGYGTSLGGDMSADGSSVVFFSQASDGSNHADVYEWRPAAGTAHRLSETPSGERGNLFSIEPVISADARIVAYMTAATNLVQRPTTSDFHIVSWDRSLLDD